MAGHLTEDPPTDDSKDRWLEDDARIFLQIHNFIDGKVLTLINHCEFVKELMDCLEFVYFGKGNISHIFDVYRAFYRFKKQDRSFTDFFMDYKKTYEELNVLLSFSPDVKVQQDQWEKMTVMGFLAALHSEYDSVKTQILSNPEVSSFQQTFSRILCIEISLLALPSTQMSNALVGRKSGESGKPQYRNSGSGGNIRWPNSGGVVCYYCHKPEHVIRDCKKLQNRNQRFPSAYITFSTGAFDQSVQFSVDELTRFHLYQKSLQSPSTPVTAIVESGNQNTCLVSSSSSEWVIGFGVIDHMTCNSSLFSTFQSQSSPSTITLAYGSKSCVLSSGIVFPTPSIPLLSILSLPNFSLNLVSVSKLTRTLKCCVSFFPDYCLFQDFMMK